MISSKLIPRVVENDKVERFLRNKERDDVSCYQGGEREEA